MLDLRVSAAFQDVQKPFDVAVCIGMRVHQRITHTSLSGQMNDLRNRLRGKEPAHFHSVSQISFGEGELLEGFQLRQPRLLQSHVVVVVDVIEPDHPLTSLQQSGRGMKADESGDTGDEDRGLLYFARDHSQSLSIERDGVVRLLDFINGGSSWSSR